MAFDAAHPLLELAVKDAVAEHRRVIMRHGLAQTGDVRRQIVELAVMAVDHVGEFVELAGVVVDDDDDLVELAVLGVEFAVLGVELAVLGVERRSWASNLRS